LKGIRYCNHPDTELFFSRPKVGYFLDRPRIMGFLHRAHRVSTYIMATLSVFMLFQSVIDSSASLQMICVDGHLGTQL
jgi:hypothetical protein